MLWLFEQDVNQQDEMGMMQCGLIPLGEPTESPALARGLSANDAQRMPLPPDWPPLRFRLVGDRLPDLWTWHAGSLIVSTSLLNALRLEPEVIQVLPIVLESENPHAGSKGYKLLRLLVGTSCMDRERSVSREVKFTIPQTDQTIQYESVSLFVLDRATVPPADLFWSEESPNRLVATDALAARVQAGGFQKPVFLDPWDLEPSGWPRTRRAPDGGRIPYRREPIGVLPARAPAQRPPFVPDLLLPEVLQRVEAAVQHRLPADYICLLQNPPPALLACDGHQYELLTDPAKVAQLNMRLRDGSNGDCLRGDPWPRDWLGIGDDMCGNYYALDLGAPSSSVLFYDHEVGAATTRAATLQEFAADLVSGYEEARSEP